MRFAVAAGIVAALVGWNAADVPPARVGAKTQVQKESFAQQPKELAGDPSPVRPTPDQVTALVIEMRAMRQDVGDLRTLVNGAIEADKKAISELQTTNAALVADIADLKKRLAALEKTPPTPSPSPTPSQADANYQKLTSAWNEALRSGKFLVIWAAPANGSPDQGEAICPGCVASTTTSGEWVNLVVPGNSFDGGTWPTPNAITVLRPVGGQMYVVGTLMPPFGAPPEAGHLWNIRQLIGRANAAVYGMDTSYASSYTVSYSSDMMAAGTGAAPRTGPIRRLLRIVTAPFRLVGRIGSGHGRAGGMAGKAGYGGGMMRGGRG